MTDDASNGDGSQITATAWLLGFMAGAVVLSLLVAAYQIGFNRGKDEGQRQQTTAGRPATTSTATTAAAGPGKEIFARTCGTCHTLSAAETTGAVGPNLDQLKPDQATVLAAIQNGGTGSGTMPPGLLQGAEAQQVAAFVAQSAGQ